MRFTVEGADSRTGADRIVEVEASSKSEAEAKARRGGILVAAIHTPIDPPNVEQSEDDNVGFSWTASPPPPPAATPTIPYQTSRPTTGGVPEYRGLRIGASVIFVFAIIYYFLGTLSIIGGIYGMFMPTNTSGPLAQLEVSAGLFQTLFGVGMAMIGAVLHALSAGCEALRDMSRHIQSKL